MATKLDLITGSSLSKRFSPYGTFNQGVSHAVRRVYVTVPGNATDPLDNAIQQVLSAVTVANPPSIGHPVDDLAKVYDISGTMLSKTKVMVRVVYRNPHLIGGKLLPPTVSFKSSSWTTKWVENSNTRDAQGFPNGEVPGLPAIHATFSNDLAGVQRSFDSVTQWAWTIPVIRATVNAITPLNPVTSGTNSLLGTVNDATVGFFGSVANPGASRFDGWTARFDGIYHVAYNFTLSEFFFKQQNKFIEEQAGPTGTEYKVSVRVDDVYPSASHTTAAFPGISG